MTERTIDYTQYTLEELRDTRRHIDASAYPERAKTLDLLIRDREAQASREPMRVSVADEDGKIAAVKPGRGVSFGQGIVEIVSSLAFLAIVFFGFLDLDDPDMRTFAAFAVFISVAGIGTGLFHLYNAFAARRFTQHDIVAPGEEPDPFDKLIGKD